MAGRSGGLASRLGRLERRRGARDPEREEQRRAERERAVLARLTDAELEALERLLARGAAEGSAARPPDEEERAAVAPHWQLRGELPPPAPPPAPGPHRGRPPLPAGP